MPTVNDNVIRALSDDGSFRVIVAKTSETVQKIVECQHVDGRNAALLGDVITGSILLRETMAPNYRVQGILKPVRNKGSISADAHPDGGTRGLVSLPSSADGQHDEINLEHGILLQVMRSLPGGTIQQGIVDVETEKGVSGALMAYMQTSEQVVSVVSIGTIVEGNQIVAAGGYIVQLLPEADKGMMMVMTERLGDFTSIEAFLKDPAFDPSVLLEELLYAMPHTTVGEGAVHFQCRCSHERVLLSLATLPTSDIEGFIKDGENLDISCDYCGNNYSILPEQLRGIKGN
jgi:molecular chaperone Hsp33